MNIIKCRCCKIFRIILSILLRISTKNVKDKELAHPSTGLHKTDPFPSARNKVCDITARMRAV